MNGQIDKQIDRYGWIDHQKIDKINTMNKQIQRQIVTQMDGQIDRQIDKQRQIQKIDKYLDRHANDRQQRDRYTDKWIYSGAKRYINIRRLRLAVMIKRAGGLAPPPLKSFKCYGLNTSQLVCISQGK